MDRSNGLHRLMLSQPTYAERARWLVMAVYSYVTAHRAKFENQAHVVPRASVELALVQPQDILLQHHRGHCERGQRDV